MSSYPVTGGAAHVGRTPRHPDLDDTVTDARTFVPRQSTERQHAR
ncbi:hypothetical protein PUR61_09455 [Streptomyces sp. BE20]|nr:MULTISPECIES: hypothetical protein [unclassified Streptomyces]MED7952056.1 hypothetical protein [Streptomyces sp. BE303]MEE1822418.1 hypothetical protein [Streptomyces sp. BE20]